MKRIQIAKTKSSPEIDFNPETNILSMSGESYPENTIQFYDPLLDWLKGYLSERGDNEVVFNIELIYFNSSSSKVLLDIFDMLEETKNDKITVNWIHDEEDEAMEEYGEEFEEDIENIKFNIQAKE